MLSGPEVAIADDKAGDGVGEGHWGRLGEFLIEGFGGLWGAGLFQGGDVVGCEVGEGENLAVAAFEAVIFLGGDEDGAFASVAGDRDGLGQGHVLVAADMALELACGDFEE